MFSVNTLLPHPSNFWRKCDARVGAGTKRCNIVPMIYEKSFRKTLHKFKLSDAKIGSKLGQLMRA